MVSRPREMGLLQKQRDSKRHLIMQHTLLVPPSWGEALPVRRIEATTLNWYYEGMQTQFSYLLTTPEASSHELFSLLTRRLESDLEFDAGSHE